MRILLLVFGVVLTLWSGTGVLLSTVYDGDRSTEESWCRRFLVCDSARVTDDALKSPNLHDATLLVTRDPHYAFEWATLADTFLLAGKKEEAEKCYRQAVELSPRWPPVLIRAMDFYFQNGNAKSAIPLAANILDQVPRYDGQIFKQYFTVATLRDVLDAGLPQDNPRPVRSWLAYLMAYGKWSDVQETWKWAVGHGLIDAKTANGYVTWLLSNHPEEAAASWKAYLGFRAGDEYLKTNYVYNGSFDAAFTGSLLDWTYRPTPGVEVIPDQSNPADGEWCLRVDFNGERNVGNTGVREDVVLPPGNYRLKAQIKTEGLNTDQGIQLRLGPEWGSEVFLGSRPWTPVEVPITVPELKVYRLELVRTPSKKFENRFKGTLWLDSVRIEPILRK